MDPGFGLDTRRICHTASFGVNFFLATYKLFRERAGWFSFPFTVSGWVYSPPTFPCQHMPPNFFEKSEKKFRFAFFLGRSTFIHIKVSAVTLRMEPSWPFLCRTRSSQVAGTCFTPPLALVSLP